MVLRHENLKKGKKERRKKRKKGRWVNEEKQHERINEQPYHCSVRKTTRIDFVPEKVLTSEGQ
jgi:hypothetical protein